jgi:hypothetical protein
MLKSFALTVVLGMGVGFACTIPNASYRLDTLSPGTTRVVQTNYSGYIPNQTVVGEQVHGPYLQADLKAYLTAILRDSALVFIARVDSIVPDSTPVAPEIALTPLYDGPGAVFAWVRVRVRVDSLLRGTLPHRTFWVRSHILNSAMCGGGNWTGFLGKPFLNASGEFSTLGNLKLPYFQSIFLNHAHWFDGRYLVAPNFPGLRLDITELYPDYPATSVYRRGVPVIPLRLDGKAYRPDGRTVPEGTGEDRKSPVPILR